jgi:glycosyltransferase involved in cell wall biosynthesis
LEQGHELGCHTYGHCNSWDTDPQTFEESVIRNREALSRLVPGAAFHSFAYPINLPRPKSKAVINGYFLACRGGGQRFNLGETDLNQLSAYFLEKSRNHVQAVKDMIDQNRNACGWLIFATHDISDSPTPYGCTPEFFEEVVQYAIRSGAQILPVARALEALGAPGTERVRARRLRANPGAKADVRPSSQPLVSILIPAMNAQEWIAGTLRSAIAQTWENKEIILVDDGSTDQTLAIARRFESDGVRVLTGKRQGAAAARNAALAASKGDYIQWLDADDLLAPEKIALQMKEAAQGQSKRTLLSGEFGKFLYRWQRAEFVPTALWSDLTPLEWLLTKMGQNLFMQTGTWLVSRDLTEAAGSWDTRLLSDDDGEYFCRVLLASDGVHFVPGARMYYRGPGVAFGSNLSYVRTSMARIRAHWLSMQLHIKYLRSLEESERVRAACLRYLQSCFIYFYPEMSDIVEEAQKLAAELGGRLEPPYLPWKYSWMKLCMGWRLTKRAQSSLLRFRWSLNRSWDKVLSQRDSGMLPGYLTIGKNGGCAGDADALS